MSRILRFGAVSAATLLAAGAVGAWPTWSAAGAAGLQSMALAAVAALAGAVAGFLPLAGAADDPLERRAQAALLGVVLRLAATAGAVAVVVLGGLAAHPASFLVWTALDYAVLLVVETRTAIALARPGGPASA
jgi:hypothetical protein